MTCHFYCTKLGFRIKGHRANAESRLYVHMVELGKHLLTDGYLNGQKNSLSAYMSIVSVFHA